MKRDASEYIGVILGTAIALCIRPGLDISHLWDEDGPTEEKTEDATFVDVTEQTEKTNLLTPNG